MKAILIQVVKHLVAPVPIMPLGIVNAETVDLLRKQATRFRAMIAEDESKESPDGNTGITVAAGLAGVQRGSVAVHGRREGQASPGRRGAGGGSWADEYGRSASG